MTEESSIPLWTYCSDQKQWKQKTISMTFYPTENETEALRVLTYNIWFSNEYQPLRFQGLCHILNHSAADVIGLQEVTKWTMDQLLEQPFVRERYFVSDIDGRSFNTWYGVILLISNRLHVTGLTLVDFPHSSMGRRLILADLQIRPNQLVRIGTVHLESLNNKMQRSEQLSICHKAFLRRSPATYILMGDFNFSDRCQEDMDHFHMLPDWIDVWKSIAHPEQYRYTFDTEINLMCKASNRCSDQSRYDRILLSSKTAKPKYIEIVGKDIIGRRENLPLFVSDHFGLFALFQWTE